MNTEITLNLNRNTIENAELYAVKNNLDLSKLIENYLNSLKKSSANTKKISPLVESLTGIIPNENIDMRKEYTDYLTRKHS